LKSNSVTKLFSTQTRKHRWYTSENIWTSSDFALLTYAVHTEVAQVAFLQQMQLWN